MPLLLLLPMLVAGCKRESQTVAVIPRTCGTPLWESEHAGAAVVARSLGLNIYWNAPMRDDDIETQISLVDKAQSRGYAGIIVAPIETLPMRTPIRQAHANGTAIVVVGTDLGIPPDRRLAYVLNDEQLGGQLAARRIGAILHGEGVVAIIGIDPRLTSSELRQRSFETTLTREFPHIKVGVRRLGFPSVPQEQQAVEELLHDNSKEFDAIIALSLASTRGAYYALVEFGKQGVIKLVGFDQDLLPPVRTGEIDSVVAENSYAMGRLAMQILDRELHGGEGTAEYTVRPVLITRENIDSPQIQQILDLSWWREQ